MRPTHPVRERIEKHTSPQPPAPQTRVHHKHRVVLDYDPKPDQPPPPPAPTPVGEDPVKVESARKSYYRGNQRLFEGDANGAIAEYHEALKIYPAYVAGYRGLGLAYAERGDIGDALSSLRQYIKAVPTARDVPIIQKRIQRLERDATKTR